MKIHFQINDSNEKHTRFTVFVDSISCGELCMLTKDFPTFGLVVQSGIFPNLGHTFEMTGIPKLEIPEARPLRKIWNPPL